MKRFSLSLALIAGLLVAIPPNANAETRTFPCGDRGTYSVSMPAGVAFKAYRCSGLLTIDSSVKIIDYRAFADQFLTSVIIPNSVTSIGDEAFQDTTELTSVIIGNSVTSIGELAFASSSLTSVTIGNSVTSIGERAFVGTELTSVIIPNSVTSIGKGAFAGSSLTSVTISSSMTSIGEGLFEFTPLTSVTIPNSVTSIGVRAFAETRLTSVTIPNSVTTIESGAFARISTLTTVLLSENLKFLGVNVFEENRSLTRIEYCGNLTGVPVTPVCPSKAAADAQAAADAKAAADKIIQDAKLEAARILAAAKAAASKKTTITCFNGKLTKKVTAVKPKCPFGYKVKK